MYFLRKLFYFFWSSYLIFKYAYKREKFEDRDVLERIILPEVMARFFPRRTLDIGREDYQFFYNHYFIGREIWTCDRKPTREEFGACNHVCCDIRHAKKHFQSNYFNFILMNGVLGWGLNDELSIEQCFDGLYDIMAPGGILIIGWNNFPGSIPKPLAEIKSLSKFQPYYFRPLKGKCFEAINGKHTYNFYIKK